MTRHLAYAILSGAFGLITMNYGSSSSETHENGDVDPKSRWVTPKKRWVRPEKPEGLNIKLESEENENPRIDRNEGNDPENAGEMNVSGQQSGSGDAAPITPTEKDEKEDSNEETEAPDEGAEAPDKERNANEEASSPHLTENYAEEITASPQTLTEASSETPAESVYVGMSQEHVVNEGVSGSGSPSASEVQEELKSPADSEPQANDSKSSNEEEKSITSAATSTKEGLPSSQLRVGDALRQSAPSTVSEFEESLASEAPNAAIVNCLSYVYFSAAELKAEILKLAHMKVSREWHEFLKSVAPAFLDLSKKRSELLRLLKTQNIKPVDDSLLFFILDASKLELEIYSSVREECMEKGFSGLSTYVQLKITALSEMSPGYDGWDSKTDEFLRRRHDWNRRIEGARRLDLGGFGD